MSEIENAIKKLLADYNNIINKLRELGAIRTTKIVSEYGEYVAAKRLGLQLASSTNKGFDATDSDGKKYEIKTRKVSPWSKPSVFPIKKSQLEVADFLVYVGFDKDWNLISLLKIPVSEVVYNKYDRVALNKQLIKKFSIL